MRIVIGADHGGFKLKESLAKFLKSKGHTVRDVGAFSEEGCDYPLIGYQAAKLVADKTCARGILICKTGIGMSMVANKVRGVRAALCDREDIARSSREHNDANVLVFAANVVSPAKAKNILKIWLKAGHLGDRHARRVRQIKEIEGLEYEGVKKNRS
ncbi:MAG: ribose 5-phosphate isomerase B [Candidatus Omnitrophota bacterium]|nr:ribose 5-phosphate isomerase B [Candidatus Omnitrophota bacterium]